MRRLIEKVAIVTGAASGIGQATAYALMREGASIVIDDINEEGAKKVATDIKKNRGKALAVKADISKEDEVKQMVEKTMAEFGRIDILVNNAAWLEEHDSPITFHEMSMTDVRHEIETSFIGTLLCCKAVIPYMLQQKSGRIISVTSDAGKIGSPTASVYSACKAAVSGFSRAIAKELATQGITVNCVSPGPIKTPYMARIFMKRPSSEKFLTSQVPMGRTGLSEDIANMIVFLASDEANYITGQDYSVDGGMRM